MHTGIFRGALIGAITILASACGPAAEVETSPKPLEIRGHQADLSVEEIRKIPEIWEGPSRHKTLPAGTWYEVALSEREFVSWFRSTEGSDERFFWRLNTPENVLHQEAVDDVLEKFSDREEPILNHRWKDLTEVVYGCEGCDDPSKIICHAMSYEFEMCITVLTQSEDRYIQGQWRKKPQSGDRTHRPKVQF